MTEKSTFDTPPSGLTSRPSQKNKIEKPDIAGLFYFAPQVGLEPTTL